MRAVSKRAAPRIQATPRFDGVPPERLIKLLLQMLGEACQRFAHLVSNMLVYLPFRYAYWLGARFTQRLARH